MIVLTTPTRNLGSKILRELLRESSTAPSLRLVARDPTKLPPGLPARVEVLQGRSDDRQILARAFDGASALFWCQPDTPDAENYEQAYVDWSRVALAALRASPISRVVAISAAGDDSPGSAGPISVLRAMERVISESGAACRFLRCGSFFSNLLWQWEGIMNDGVFCYNLPGDVPGPQVAPEDTARVAASLLLDPSWRGSQALSLCGPRDLTYDEMAAELSLVLDRPVRYQAMSADAYRELCIQTGLSPSAASGLAGMFDYLATRHRPIPEPDRALTPTHFADWLKANVIQ